jgi:hypothetical protein
MKKNYNKPRLFLAKDPYGIVPLGVAVAGLALFATAGAAVGGLAAFGAGMSKKLGNNSVRQERLPALDFVEVYA